MKFTADEGVGDPQSLIWDAAVELAQYGDVDMLVGALRNPRFSSPPRRALELAAELLDGKIKIRRRRGPKSRARDHAVSIRALYEQFNSDLFARCNPELHAELRTQRAQFDYIARLYRISWETVRDVVDRRKTFGEK